MTLMSLDHRTQDSKVLGVLNRSNSNEGLTSKARKAADLSLGLLKYCGKAGGCDRSLLSARDTDWKARQADTS